MPAYLAQIDYKTNTSSEEPQLAGIYSFPDWFTKSIYIFLPWVILSIAFFLTMDTGRANAIVGVIMMASLFLVVGLNLPDFKEYPWVMRWLYPWGAMILSVLLIMFWDKRKQRLALANN